MSFNERGHSFKLHLK